MKKVALLLLIIPLLSSYAQTTLSPGDIAIVRENEINTAEGFSFVTLVPIAAGTVVYFTDEGWAGTAWYGTSEVHIKYTVPAGGLAAGSVVHIDETASGSNVTAVTGAGGTSAYATWSPSSTFNLSAGESIIAYQASISTGTTKPTSAQLTFITGIMLNDGTSVSEVYDPTTLWTSSSITVATVSTCQIPTGLTNGINCFSMFAGDTEPIATFSVRYKVTTSSGTKAQLRSAINNKANWENNTTSNGYISSDVGSFTVNNATITFTNGSGFTQNFAPGSTNQVIGRFQLTASITGSYLTDATITLNGTRTGMSNLKLWSSSDNSFSSSGDTQLGSTVSSDPGNGGSVTFNNFSSPIGTSGVFYFVTADVAASPSGTVQGIISSNSSFTIDSGTLSGIITNAVLSSNTAALPVELTSFSVECIDGKVLLNWNTATEVNNYGFNIERCKVQEARDKGWEKIAFVQGHGNSNSPKNYSFTDVNAPSGKVQYRLKQIDFDGRYEYSDVVEVKVETPKSFSVKQNYPNPFNPSTTIKYELPTNSFVTIKIFDVIGREIATLVNGNEQAGIHQINFDAKNLPSGMYVYKVQAGSYSQIKKMILVK